MRRNIERLNRIFLQSGHRPRTTMYHDYILPVLRKSMDDTIKAVKVSFVLTCYYI